MLFRSYSNQTQDLCLYVNGQQVVTAADVIFDPPANASLTIAGGQDAVFLDEVALYSSALSYSPQPSSAQTANSLDLLNSFFGTNQIGEKYAAQYVAPLPPGPQLQVSLLDPSGTSPAWSSQDNVIPMPYLQATTLSDANVPVADIVSSTAANVNGSVSPNGDVDTVYQISQIGRAHV